MWKPRPREEEPVESCPEVGIVFWIWRVPGSTGQEKVGRVRVLFPSAGHPDMALFGQTDELYFMQEGESSVTFPPSWQLKELWDPFLKLSSDLSQHIIWPWI